MIPTFSMLEEIELPLRPEEMLKQLLDDGFIANITEFVVKYDKLGDEVNFYFRRKSDGMYVVMPVRRETLPSNGDPEGIARCIRREGEMLAKLILFLA